MENRSGLKPAAHAVLVKPYQPERKGSLIVVAEGGSDAMIEQRAVVIEVGPLAWASEGIPRAKPGDKVLLARFAGHFAKGTLDGEQYRFVNERDIFALIVAEADQ